MARNPFVPSFGTDPHVLVGRDSILDDFDEAFDEAPTAPGLSVLIAGQRGVGKTVLLNHFQHTAHRRGWLAIAESASPGLLDRLTRDHLPRLLAAHSPEAPTRVRSRSFGLAGANYQEQWEDRYPADATLRSQITEVTDVLAKHETGLVITVDEVQSASIEELRKLGEVLQHCRREERPVGFAAAGLTGPLDALLDHDGVTFLRRAQRYDIARVPVADVAEAMDQTVRHAGREFAPGALAEAARASQGYPYLIQLVGQQVWKQHPETQLITAEDVTAGAIAARRRMGNNVHAPAMRSLSEVDRSYLLAMAVDEGEPSRTGEVAKRLGVSPQYAGVYRSRLLASGVIEDAGHGKVRFTIPFLGQYLREHVAVDAMSAIADSAGIDQ